MRCSFCLYVYLFVCLGVRDLKPSRSVFYVYAIADHQRRIVIFPQQEQQHGGCA